MARVSAIVLFIGFLALASAEQTKVTPTQKVIELLDGMVAKGKAEKQAEQVQFAAYKQWCDDSSNEKKNDIAEANEQIDILHADAEKYEADAERLGHEISELDEDLAHYASEIKAAVKARAMEHADFEEEQADHTSSVEQLGLAIQTMKEQPTNVAQQAAVLLQVAKLPIDDESRNVIHSYLGMEDKYEDEDAENLAMASPQASAFESSSDGIIDLFKKLKDKFEGKLAETQKDELNMKNEHEMYVAGLEDQKNTATRSRESKSEAKAKNLQDEADSRGAHQDTMAARDADAKFLSDMEATCAQKASDFEQRQELRGEEIEAVEKAKEILSSGSVSGAADKHLPALVQKSKAGKKVLAQLRKGNDAAKNPNQVRLAKWLKQEGARINSKVLVALSLRVAYDPFASVKKMIKELIDKLLTEANEEAEQKGFCDQELATNEQTRTEKTEAVDLLNSEIDELSATIGQLTEEISQLTQAVAASDSAAAEATDIREKESEKNAETIDDAKKAQEAVAQALTVLKDFYDNAAGATALVQTKKNGNKKQPEIFDAPYTGMQSNAGGVVGMIEVIQSDFARLEAETQSAEAAGKKEYDQFMHDSKVDKTAKSKDIEHKKAKKQNAEQALTEKKEDLVGTQKELTAALAYYEKLKPTCVDSGISYEDRVARRKAEIESLGEALKILSGDDIAVFLQQ